MEIMEIIFWQFGMAYDIINFYTLVLAILWILKTIQTCTYDKFERQNLIKY